MLKRLYMVLFLNCIPWMSHAHQPFSNDPPLTEEAVLAVIEQLEALDPETHLFAPDPQDASRFYKYLLSRLNETNGDVRRTLFMYEVIRTDAVSEDGEIQIRFLLDYGDYLEVTDMPSVMENFERLDAWFNSIEEN